MTCALGCLSTISTVIVAIQFFAKVVPWLYENIIGPMILGPKLKLRDYGDWACKFQSIFDSKLKLLDFLLEIHISSCYISRKNRHFFCEMLYISNEIIRFTYLPACSIDCN